MTTAQHAQPLDLDAVRPWVTPCGSHDYGEPMPCTCPDGDPRPVMVRLVAEVERLRALSKPTHDPSRPTPPLPLAEGDTVTVTMPARVAGLPDPEADPGAADELWDLEITVAGETEYVSLTQAEVIAQVRKP